MKRLCCSGGPGSSRHVLTEEETDAVTRRAEMGNKLAICNPSGFVNMHFSCPEWRKPENKKNKRTFFLSAFY